MGLTVLVLDPSPSFGHMIYWNPSQWWPVYPWENVSDAQTQECHSPLNLRMPPETQVAESLQVTHDISCLGGHDPAVPPLCGETLGPPWCPCPCTPQVSCAQHRGRTCGLVSLLCAQQWMVNALGLGNSQLGRNTLPSLILAVTWDQSSIVT